MEFEMIFKHYHKQIIETLTGLSGPGSNYNERSDFTLPSI